MSKATFTDEKIKVAVSIPNYGDNFDARTVHSLVICMCAWSKLPRYQLMFNIYRNGLLPKVYDQMVNDGLNLDTDYFLFLEDDHIWPVDGFEKLMAHDLDIVSGMSWSKRNVGKPIMYKIVNYIPGIQGHHVPLSEWEDLQEVDYCGQNMLLVKRHVFDNIPQPWFSYQKGYGCPGDIGEDAYFFTKAKEFGFKTFVDTTINIPHLGTRAIYTEGGINIT